MIFKFPGLGQRIRSEHRDGLLTPGHIAPAEVSRVAGPGVPGGGVARGHGLGPGGGLVAGVVVAGLHREGPGADDVGLPVGVGGGVE